MNFQTHLKILAVEPQPNGMTLIEAAAPDGTNAMIVTRMAEPLAVGGDLALTLQTEPAAISRATATLRDRMNGRLAAATHATGAASTPGVTQTAASAAGASSTPRAGAMGEATSLLLSTILGGPSPTSAFVERDAASMDRDVDDEMDALLGAPRKG